MLVRCVEQVYCESLCVETLGSEGEGDERTDEEAEEWAINVLGIQLFSW